MAESLKAKRSFADDPNSKKIFQNNGAGFQVGDIIKQPELAATLERIQTLGAKDFYEGETAHLLADAMAKHGGLVTLDDLKNYQAVERVPLTGSYRNYTVISAPPPSSGGIGLLQMLGMLDGSGYEKSGAGSAASIHYVAEVMRRYFADRSEYLGDPDFVKIPVSKLLDPAYIRSRRASIDPAHVTPSAELKPGLPAGEIAQSRRHYSIVDSQGNAVAVTYTLNEALRQRHHRSGPRIPSE